MLVFQKMVQDVTAYPEVFVCFKYTRLLGM